MLQLLGSAMANQTAASDGDPCPSALDRALGPTIPQLCSGGFDFTLVFE